MSEEDRIMADAVRWHLASAGDDMDWDGFTTWLEADARHPACYDEVALADDLVVRNAAAIPAFATQTAEGQRRRLRVWFGAAVAAVLVIAAGFGMLGRASDTVYETGDGARAIALADGSQVMLAPHSRLDVAGDGRTLKLAGGGWFDIRHVPGRHLAITAGPVKIHDIGTRFVVQAEAGMVRIAVAEGTLQVSAPSLSGDIRLDKGRGLLFDGQVGKAEIGAIDVVAAGGWRQGRLTYDDAPLTLVTADLARYARLRVAVPKGLVDRRFSGTLATSDGQQQVRDLSQLMGLALLRDGTGYRLAERPR